MSDLGHPNDMEVEEPPVAEPEPDEAPDDMPEGYIADPLDRALTLRVPVFRVKDTEASERTDAYEEHMMLSAYTGADLAYARHQVRVRQDDIADEWDAMEGWEFYMTGKPRTDKGVELAKTEASPELAAERRKLKRREARLTEEIERMEQDAKFCSRAYTLLSRGS